MVQNMSSEDLESVPPATIEEIYETYGRAMHQIQRFERMLLIAVAENRVFDQLQEQQERIHESKLAERIFAAIKAMKPQEKTLGASFTRLFPDYKKRVNYKKRLGSEEIDLLELRNRIAHQFFTDRDLAELLDSRFLLKAWAELYQRKTDQGIEIMKKMLRTRGLAPANIEAIWGAL